MNKSNIEKIIKEQKKLIDAVLELYDEYNKNYENDEVSECSEEKVKKINKLLNFNKKSAQEDAQEFLNKLLEKVYEYSTITVINKKNNNLNSNNFIDKDKDKKLNGMYKNFGIIEHSDIKCANNKNNNNYPYTSTQHNLVNMIQIESTYENITTFLNNVRNEYEDLSNDNPINKCKEKGTNTYKRIYYIPHDEMSNYLIFQIKVFDFNNNASKKDSSDIKIKPEDELNIKSLKNQNIEYEKLGTIYHIGPTISSGHYITDIETRVNGESKTVTFDDNLIYEPKNNRDKTPYLVIYKKKSLLWSKINNKGIKNYGQTCFFNSVFQNLFRLPSFIEDLKEIQKTYKDAPSDSPTKTLSDAPSDSPTDTPSDAPSDAPSDSPTDTTSPETETNNNMFETTTNFSSSNNAKTDSASNTKSSSNTTSSPNTKSSSQESTKSKGNSSSKLPPINGLVRLVIDFKEMDDIQQAKYIIKIVKKMIETYDYDKIGITYSANGNQTKEIIEKYNKNNVPMIEGANQASVLNKLLEHDDYKNIKEKFRIIPFTTMEWQKNEDNNIEECINFANKFLDNEKNVIIGWANQNTEENKLAIGGGVSKTTFVKYDDWVDKKLKKNKEDLDDMLKNIIDSFKTSRKPETKKLTFEEKEKQKIKNLFKGNSEYIIKNELKRKDFDYFVKHFK